MGHKCKQLGMVRCSQKVAEPAAVAPKGSLVAGATAGLCGWQKVRCERLLHSASAGLQVLLVVGTGAARTAGQTLSGSMRRRSGDRLCAGSQCMA